MPRQPKTVAVATYPDGHEVNIVKGPGGMWTWDTGSASSHFDSAVENAKEAGATVTRKPNPNYRPRLDTFERLTRGIR